MNQTNLENQRQNDRIPYNGEPLQEGYVLVPQMINSEYAELIDAIGVRTWYRCGVPYQVMFVPVPIDQAGLALKTLNNNVNDHLDEKLGPNRYSRCMIRHPDGSIKPCPKEVNGKYNPCGLCPNRGKLDKENRSTVSLETLDEDEFHPMDAASSAEECALLGFILDDLLKDLPQFAEIIRLGYQGLSRKEIIAQLPVKKSQAYQLFNECKKQVEEYLKN